MPELLFSFSPRLHALRQGAQQLYRIVPPEAGVGDALPEGEGASGLEVLATTIILRGRHTFDRILTTVVAANVLSLCAGLLL